MKHLLTFSVVLVWGVFAAPLWAAEECCSTEAGAAAHEHTGLTAHADAAPPAPWDAAILEVAATIPVQDGGRVKPLGTLARFSLLQINGSREYRQPEGGKM